MKNITIAPANDEIRLLAKMVQVKNEFINMGFSERKPFINLVQETNDKYIGYQQAVLLERWWVLRSRDECLTEDLELIIENLKNE